MVGLINEITVNGSPGLPAQHVRFVSADVGVQLITCMALGDSWSSFLNQGKCRRDCPMMMAQLLSSW